MNWRNDEGGAFQLRSVLLRKHVNNANESGWYLVIVIKLLHIFGDIFHNVLSHYVVDIVEVLTTLGTGMSGDVYKRILYRTRHEI